MSPTHSGQPEDTVINLPESSTKDRPEPSTTDCPEHSTTDLPPHEPMPPPRFTWGEIDSEFFIQQLNVAYTEVTHWSRNIFTIPSGKAGKEFVRELSRLFRSYASASALESVALKTATVSCILLLQKPFHSSKTRDHTSCLERRLINWKTGDMNNLLHEGRTIQQRLTQRSSPKEQEQQARASAPSQTSC